ncbi:MAG: hydrogenase 3 maturation endopeptidase HyCI [Candidatus Ancaeobacter aquaticus]|nr:hydrogenase 3 maturation endopeptidase HyCI [Candidatus Ancaeobacter aquaticus]
MSSLLTDKVIEGLIPQTANAVYITAGNTFRSDDGVGPYIASFLSNNERIRVIDAGHTPENIIDEAVSLRPDSLIFIDAANFGGEPGEVRVIPEEAIPNVTMSTHSIPLNVIAKLIESETKAKTTFIGVQIQNIALGETITDPVKRAGDEIVRVIMDRQKE